MAEEEKCEVSGCGNKAARITSTETRFIMICQECFDQKYRV
jgi:hypothetical protein